MRGLVWNFQKEGKKEKEKRKLQAENRGSKWGVRVVMRVLRFGIINTEIKEGRHKKQMGLPRTSIPILQPPP